MEKMFLICYTTGGVYGHKMAAQALASNLKRRNVPVETVDVLEYATVNFKRLFTDGYLLLSERQPYLWKLLYGLTDRYDGIIQPQLRNYVVNTLRPLYTYFGHLNPYAIVCTHYLPVWMLSYSNPSKSVVYCVPTDYMPHKAWLDKKVDGYFVASIEYLEALVKSGIEKSKVHVTGIPISINRALTTVNENACRSVLFVASGMPFGLVKLSISRILNYTNLTLHLVTGRNSELNCKIERLPRLEDNRFIQYDFLSHHKFHEIASQCCVAITKAGGLTTSEFLALSLPMIITKPIPGHEELNASYLISKGVARQADTPNDILNVLIEVTSDKKKLETMRQCCREIAHPYAADIITSLLIRPGITNLHY
jgi:processive 1,2-diacylglycerol beta-glucosyltransferase